MHTTTLIHRIFQTVTTACLVLLLVSTLCTPVHADGDAEMNEISELKALIQQLSQRLETIEKKQAAQQKIATKNKQNIGKIYKKSSKMEGAMEKYKVSWGANLKSMYYSLHNKVENADSGDAHNVFLTAMDLKLAAEPTKELQLHGTLSMYKVWGADKWMQYPYSRDANRSSSPSNSALYVKRIYADYRPEFLDYAVNFEFGRLPTSGGYLTQYRYNEPRQSSYPDLAFNGETDGAALTLFLNQWVSWLNNLTVVYSKLSQSNEKNPFASSDLDLKDTTVFVAQLDMTVPGLDNSHLSFNWLRPMDFMTPVLDAPRISTPRDLGGVDKLTAQFDMEQAFGSPIDFFVSGSWMRTDPNGDPAVYMTAAGPMSIGLGSDDNQDAHTAWAFYSGVRWNIGYEPLRNPKLGLEFNYGSKYWSAFNYAAMDPYRKLETKGWATEIYYVQPLVEDMLQLRFSWQHFDRDYDHYGTIYGEPQRLDQRDEVFFVGADLSI